jgi:hypothetical protein
LFPFFGCSDIFTAAVQHLQLSASLTAFCADAARNAFVDPLPPAGLLRASRTKPGVQISPLLAALDPSIAGALVHSVGPRPLHPMQVPLALLSCDARPALEFFYALDSRLCVYIFASQLIDARNVQQQQAIPEPHRFLLSPLDSALASSVFGAAASHGLSRKLPGPLPPISILLPLETEYTSQAPNLHPPFPVNSAEGQRDTRSDASHAANSTLEGNSLTVRPDPGREGGPRAPDARAEVRHGGRPPLSRSAPSTSVTSPTLAYTATSGLGNAQPLAPPDSSMALHMTSERPVIGPQDGRGTAEWRQEPRAIGVSLRAGSAIPSSMNPTNHPQLQQPLVMPGVVLEIPEPMLHHQAVTVADAGPTLMHLRVLGHLTYPDGQSFTVIQGPDGAPRVVLPA